MHAHASTRLPVGVTKEVKVFLESNVLLANKKKYKRIRNRIMS